MIENSFINATNSLSFIYLKLEIRGVVIVFLDGFFKKIKNHPEFDQLVAKHPQLGTRKQQKIGCFKSRKFAEKLKKYSFLCFSNQF